MTNDLTTLVCLFHHQDQAKAAWNDLLTAGVPQNSITMIDRSTGGRGDASSLLGYGLPDHDIKHLQEGLEDGGTIVAVSAIADHVDQVEDIFTSHRAKKIDEALTEDEGLPLAAAAGAGAAIPIVEETLEVGKRTVDRGGVRVFRRVVEVPVQETVSLREEHVSVERHAVDRAVTDADLALQGSRTIELTETAEEAVVGKSARVVEEVLVGKDTMTRNETIHDTVRRTEVEMEEIDPKLSASRISTERTS